MTARHATREELEGYVTGALTGDPAASLEAHVEACPACAEALAREARFETALHQVAGEGRVATPPRAVRRRGVRAPIVFAAAAMAAGLALWLARPRATATLGAPRVVCGVYDDAQARQCRAAARCAGLFVEDATAADVPAYEIIPRDCEGTPGLSFFDGRNGPM